MDCTADRVETLTSGLQPAHQPLPPVHRTSSATLFCSASQMFEAVLNSLRQSLLEYRCQRDGRAELRVLLEEPTDHCRTSSQRARQGVNGRIARHCSPCMSFLRAVRTLRRGQEAWTDVGEGWIRDPAIVFNRDVTVLYMSGERPGFTSTQYCIVDQGAWSAAWRVVGPTRILQHVFSGPIA